MDDAAAPKGWINPTRRRADLVAAAVLLLFGAAFLWGASSLDFGQSDAPGAALFPTLVATALMLVSVALLVQRSAKPAPDDGEAIPLGHTYSVVAACVLLAATLVFERAGFPVVAFATLLVLARMFAGCSLLRALLFAFFATASAYLLFTRVFEVVLPLGVWMAR